MRGLLPGSGGYERVGCRGGHRHGETALRLAKNPMLPFKLAMKSRRTGWGGERGRVNFGLKFSFIIHVIKIKKLNGENDNQQHSKISRVFFFFFPPPQAQVGLRLLCNDTKKHSN